MKLMRILLFAILLFPAILLAQRKETYKLTIVVEKDSLFRFQCLAKKAEYNIDSDYSYSLILKLAKGMQNIKWVSDYDDTLEINIDIQGDSTIYLKDLTKDFYSYPDSDSFFFNDLKNGDVGYIGGSVSVCISGAYYIDIPFFVNEKGISLRKTRNYISRKSRKIRSKLSPKNILSDIQSVERIARRMESKGVLTLDTSFDITIVKNRQIFRYRGRANIEEHNELIRLSNAYPK